MNVTGNEPTETRDMDDVLELTTVEGVGQSAAKSQGHNIITVYMY